MPIPKNKKYTLILNEKEFEGLKSLVNSPYSFDPTGDPNESQFGYCKFCDKVEYKKHDKDCLIPFLQSKLKLVKSS